MIGHDRMLTCTGNDPEGAGAGSAEVTKLEGVVEANRLDVPAAL